MLCILAGILRSHLVRKVIDMAQGLKEKFKNLIKRQQELNIKQIKEVDNILRVQAAASEAKIDLEKQRA